MNTKPEDQSVLEFLSEKMKMMETQTCPSPSTRKPSMQMRAVLLIFNADPHLMEAVAPHINLETETIYWDKISRLPFGSGHRAAVQWAYGCWRDESPKGNLFDGALNMNPHFKIAVLEALCLRWGLRG